MLQKLIASAAIAIGFVAAGIPIASHAKNSKVDALVETALSAKQAGKLDAAIATLETAVEIDPTHTGALLALGRTYGAKQDYDKARR